MKKNLSLLATLALAATLSPAAFAQQDQTPQPGANDPQTQSTPAPDTSADAQTPKSFSGTVVKMQKQYVLKTDTCHLSARRPGEGQAFQRQTGERQRDPRPGDQHDSCHRHSTRLVVDELPGGSTFGSGVGPPICSQTAHQTPVVTSVTASRVPAIYTVQASNATRRHFMFSGRPFHAIIRILDWIAEADCRPEALRITCAPAGAAKKTPTSICEKRIHNPSPNRRGEIDLVGWHEGILCFVRSRPAPPTT